MVRLALLADRELSAQAMKSLADKLSHQELEELRKSYARRAGERFPLKTQLSYETKAAAFDEENTILSHGCAVTAPLPKEPFSPAGGTKERKTGGIRHGILL